MRFLFYLTLLLLLANPCVAEDNAKASPLWPQIATAIEQSDYRTLLRLRNGLSTTDSSLVTLWLNLRKNPQALARHQIKPTEIGTLIVADVFRLYIHDHLNNARALWNSYESTYPFTSAQKYKIYRAFALEYTFINNSQSHYWFSKLSYDPSDTTILEWRVRERIAHRDWVRVKNTINDLPDNLRSQTCWQYWLARAYMHLGDENAARPIFAKLSLGRNYYGFLASAHLSISPRIQDELYNTRLTALSEVLSNPLLQECKHQYQDGDIRVARNNWQRLISPMDDEQKYWAAKLASTWGWYDQAIYTAQKIQHQDDLQLRFPIALRDPLTKLGNNTKIPTAFLLAIIRQESSFQTDAASLGGAVGIMQLLPSTAYHFSRTKGWVAPNRNGLLKVSTSLKIGTHYLDSLVKQLDGNYVLAAAAYNAGIGRISEWKKHWQTNDPTIWIENLPWQETRDYVKNIVTFYIIYRHHLNQPMDIVQLFSGRETE